MADFPGVRPQAIARSRSDNSQRVEGGTNVNTAGVRLRDELAPDESRHTFAIVFDDDHANSNYPYVQAPLQPGETRSTVYLEGYLEDIQGGATPATALSNNQGQWQPPAGLNLITTLTATSFTAPASIKPYVNDNLQSIIQDDDPGWSFGQVAELSELQEFVNLLGDTLDGSNTIRWDVANDGTTAIKGSVIIRLLGKEVDV